MKQRYLWLFTIILIALALRLTLLGEQSLWYDEGVTWLLAHMRQPGELIQWTAADIQPPLYYLLMWEIEFIFGQSEWALRFPSVVFNVLTVPLIYVLARRLWPWARLDVRAELAATLLAISPLMVYYSQEARMYTLLVFEVTLASYLLLRILSLPGPIPQSQRSPMSASSFSYALTMAAALYTHYFAVFLLMAHALYFGFILWQRRFPRAMLFLGLQIFGLISLLFAPWLPILFSRWGDDPSYWPGALKLNEAIRHLLISFTAGETVFEQTGFWLALGYLFILLLCAIYSIAAGRWRTTDGAWQMADGRRQMMNGGQLKGSRFTFYVSSFLLPPSSFLLLWLLLPITFTLLLSYQSPKFNPRYTLLAYPAFVLLTAAGLAQLLPQPRTPGATDSASSPPRLSPAIIPHPSRFTRHVSEPKAPYGRFTHHISSLLFILALLFIYAISAFSLSNWFTDPRFSKDDFKALAQFVRERIDADETVLLRSGHLFPVWAYYYGWEGWTPLPKMERLDVSRVIELGIATELAAALEGQGGVWLVSWQDEVIDPNGVAPFWLDLIGRRPVDAGDFWGVKLEHWRLEPDGIERLSQDPIQYPVAANPSSNSETNPAPSSGLNFANQIELLGMTQLSDTDIALFWRPRQPLPDNLILTLSLSDQAGFNWTGQTSSGQPGAYLYPPSRWPVGQVIMTRHQLSWQTGTPPGLYRVEVNLGQAAGSNPTSEFIGWDVLDQQGRPQRRTVILEPINLSGLVRAGSETLSLPAEPLVDFSPIITLRHGSLAQEQAEPGDRVLLRLLWQAGEFNLDDISIAFDLIDAQEQTFRVGSSLTPSRNFNLPRWQPGDIVLGQYWLAIPPTAAPGPATLQLRLVNTGAYVYDEIFPFAQLEILPSQRIFTPPPAVDMPLEADFSGQIMLLGADCHSPGRSGCQAAPGNTITLILYWQATALIETDYTAFTHLLGPEERVIVNADHLPPKSTQSWVSGEIITDSITLTIPVDLPPGHYPIEVGLYNAADPAFQRLSLTAGEGRVILPEPLRVE